jgi:integrase
MRQKTKQSDRLEITKPTREAVAAWVMKAELAPKDFLFPSRLHDRICRHGSMPVWWRAGSASSGSILQPGTHTMRRTKASLIYRQTHNLRAVQLLFGHTKLESTVRYLGIEVDDALEMAEETEA